MTLARRYWWDGMYRDVHAHGRSCLTCSTYQGTGQRSRQPLLPIPVGEAFHHVGVDIMELPLTANGNWYIITFIDYLSGLSHMPVVTRPVKPLLSFSLTMLCVGKVCLSTWFLIGALICLNADVYKVTGVQKLSPTAYHPQMVWLRTLTEL